MPSKHINFSQSLLGFGSYILNKLTEPKTIDDLWIEYQKDVVLGYYSFSHSFDNLMITLIFLFGINTIKEEKGVLLKCN